MPQRSLHTNDRRSSNIRLKLICRTDLTLSKSSMVMVTLWVALPPPLPSASSKVKRLLLSAPKVWSSPVTSTVTVEGYGIPPQETLDQAITWSIPRTFSIQDVQAYRNKLKVMEYLRKRHLTK